MVATPARTQNFSSPQKEANTAQPRTISHFGFIDQVGELPTTPLFGTDGIRGRVGGLLNAPLALQVGFWAGQVLRQQAHHPGPVILGQDTRTSGNMLAMALSAGLIAAGLEVWHIGVCPTPGVSYLTLTSEAIGGVMISASHNPPGRQRNQVFWKRWYKIIHRFTRANRGGN